ncbi:hypothetical protein WNY51_08325 [Pseudocolwellia sp. AS88]
MIDQFQFKALWLNNGYYLINQSNDEVLLLKHFSDEFKLICAALLNEMIK